MGKEEPVRNAKPKKDLESKTTAAVAQPAIRPSPVMAIRPGKPLSNSDLDAECANMRRKAQTRLDQLFLAAATARFWGTIAVEVIFKNGQAVSVLHRMEGTDKE